MPSARRPGPQQAAPGRPAGSLPRGASAGHPRTATVRKAARRERADAQKRSDEPADVVGFPLEEARRMLAAGGWQEGETTGTLPPRRGLVGPNRVVRQRVDENGRVALVVCGELSEDARV